MNSEKNEKFSVVIPASLEKSESGEWRVYGLASSPKRDQQGEVMDMKGLDLSPIEAGKGILNIDHKKGFENTVGVIDSFKKCDDGLYLGGYLFQNHDRAKAAYQIMSSLKKSDKGRMGMSVEGIIKERAGKDGKIIKKAVITACALTMSPVNDDTYVNLVKSFTDGVEFEGTSLSDDFMPAKEGDQTQAPSFTAAQVVELLQKALGIGSAYATSTPAQLSGGDALAQEDLDSKKKKKKEASPEPKEEESESPLKKGIADVLEQLQVLYPEASRTELWEAVKDRLNRRFLNDSGE